MCTVLASFACVLNGIAEVHVALENTCRAHWTCEKYIYCTVYVYFQSEEVCNEMCCSFFFSFFGLKPAVVLPLQLRASHLCISSFFFFPKWGGGVLYCVFDCWTKHFIAR